VSIIVPCAVGLCLVGSGEHPAILYFHHRPTVLHTIVPIQDGSGRLGKGVFEARVCHSRCASQRSLTLGTQAEQVLAADRLLTCTSQRSAIIVPHVTASGIAIERSGTAILMRQLRYPSQTRPHRGPSPGRVLICERQATAGCLLLAQPRLVGRRD
jgi:hypothetical protein